MQLIHMHFQHLLPKYKSDPYVKIQHKSRHGLEFLNITVHLFCVLSSTWSGKMLIKPEVENI